MRPRQGQALPQPAGSPSRRRSAGCPSASEPSSSRCCAALAHEAPAVAALRHLRASGAGKGTLIRGVLDRDPDIARRGRVGHHPPPAPGEEDGREYYFLSDDEFQRRVDAGAFVEHVSFAGGRYGTLKEEIDRLLGEGRNVILELEVEGAFAIRRRRPDACLIFIDAAVRRARAAAARRGDRDRPARSRCGSRSPASSSESGRSSTT